MTAKADREGRVLAFVCHGPVVLAEAVQRGMIKLGDRKVAGFAL
jgi:putative intracellular protease/amidase